MNKSTRMSTISPTILVCAVALTFFGSVASAADNDLRIVPQVTGGTAGLEPGLAMEWRSIGKPSFILRPEVFVSKDDRIGGGGALLFDISTKFDMPVRHAIAVGPRIVYHNADHYSWDADLMVTWGYDLKGGTRAWQHSVGALGAVGAIRDKRYDEIDLSTTAGVFYSYRF